MSMILTKRLMQATKEKLYLQTIYRMWIHRATSCKDLNFEGVLSQELGRCKHQSLDKKISELDTSKLTANVYTDHSNYSYRMDGNNVDIDTENVELASEQIKYEALTSSISSQFSRMKSVL